MLNLQTQRGCALRCCYCTYPLLEGRHYRRRPAEAVVEDLARMEQQGARYVFIVDSVFNTSPTHVSGICEGILKRGLKLQWCCFLRPKNLSRELIQLMSRAGLKHVEFGSDSFSDEVLNHYGKALTFDDILQSSQHAAAANVDCAHFLILGGPGETEKTLEETFTNSKRLPEPTLMARVGMRVYPGTPLHDQLQASAGGPPLPPLLTPFYYIQPPLTQEQVLTWLRRRAAELPNWIYDDPPPEYYKLAERLRARGIIGPLWSYFAMMQRLGGLGAPPPPRRSNQARVTEGSEASHEPTPGPRIVSIRAAPMMRCCCELRTTRAPCQGSGSQCAISGSWRLPMNREVPALISNNLRTLWFMVPMHARSERRLPMNRPLVGTPPPRRVPYTFPSTRSMRRMVSSTSPVDTIPMVTASTKLFSKTNFSEASF